MEQSNKIQRSEVWEQIFKIVKTIPRADCNGMDAPDALSVTTELEELFLKSLSIQHVSKAKRTFCDGCMIPDGQNLGNMYICPKCGRSVD